MRVIAGLYKGRTIHSVPGNATRPTTDRVREAWASVVTSALPDGFVQAQVLDAFAGSGALGIEALSRGAANCSFYENDPRAFQTLKRNLADLGISAMIRKSNVLAEAKRAPLRASDPFNLVILDPPYSTDTRQVCGFILDLVSHGDLNEIALISYEHARGGFNFQTSQLASTTDIPNGFELLSCKTYGSTQIDFIIYRQEDEECVRH